MEYANEKIINIGYKEEKTSSKENKTSFFRKHKILSLILMATTLLIAINVVLIYMFFYILNTL